MSFAGKFDGTLSDGQGSYPHGRGHVDSVSTHAPAGAIIVQDAHLLFTGDFKRSGVDLILSADDRKLVLHDYFKGEKHAALASPDGAHLTGDIVDALSGYTQFAQADGSASVAQVIGHVTKLTGTATVIRNGVSIILNQGDNVNKGDVVQSGSDSTLGITFIDGSVFGLASNAKMVLNEMIYDPNGSNNSSLISLVQGTISFVAGATAKHGDMKVDTPVATMGIRGTAVLVEIDFDVPAQGGAPPAKFQVLVEPDGTTGSYILFDKTTLTPIATVNLAGTQTIVNGQGTVSFNSAAQLSPDAQNIIQQVFAQKYTDNSNPKDTTHFTSNIINDTQLFKLANGDPVSVTVKVGFVPDNSTPQSNPNTPPKIEHIPGPPAAAALNGAFTELDNLTHTITHSSTVDTVSDKISWGDINAGDIPSASAKFDSFTYTDAHNHDVTASLTAEQLAAIQAVEIPLTVVQDPGNLNHGTATWTYSIADGAFDFLAAGETLTLTYMARVDNNYAPNDEFTLVPITITITGTNDAPTIATSGSGITERLGTGNTAIDTASGTVTFTDVDLTDRPIVSAAISTDHPFRYLDAQGHDITGSLTAEQLAAIAAVEIPLTVVQAAGNTHNGTATWTYSIADKAFDFIAKGETLTLNYVAEVDDGHGGVVSTPITVSINGADISITGTDDVPVITSGPQTGAITELDGTLNASTPDQAIGAVTFTDVDLTDTHAVTITGVSTSGITFGLADHATVLGWLSLGALTDSTDGAAGSRPWTFSAADKSFDYLAAGETLTLAYTIEVDDHHGGVVTQPVTIIVTGSNDAPDVAADVSGTAGSNLHGITEQPNKTGDSADSDGASGSLAFTDVDLSDTHNVDHSKPVFSWSDAEHNPLTLSSTQQDALTAASALALTLHESTGTGAGSVDFNYSAADSSFDFLAAGETLIITYDVTVTDEHNVSSTQPVTITVTGTNDAPAVAAALADNVNDDDAAFTRDLLGGASDVDDGETATLHVANVSYAVDGGDASGTAPAGVSLGADGHTLTIDPTDPAFDYLTAGEHTTIVVSYDVTDAQGATVPQTETITINGIDDGPTVSITVLTPDSLDFKASGPLAEMGAGAIQPGQGSTTFTIVDSADNVSFVVDGSNFAYSSSGDVTSIAGGTLTSFHEFNAEGTALADFTGLSVDAVTWMNDVKLAAHGDTSAIDALTSTFAYTFTGGPGNDAFGSAGHADTLTGGAGSDALDPGGAPSGGHDTVTGGAGSDTIIYQAGYGALTITDFDQGNETSVFDPNEADQIQLNGLTAPLSVSYANGNAILDFGNNDVVTLLHVSQAQYEALDGSEFTYGGNNGGGDGGGNNSGGPVIGNADNTVTYTATPVFIDPSVAVSDDTATVTSVNVWISAGFQSGDQLTISGSLDGDIGNSDGSTIHYHYDANEHGIYLYTANGNVTLDDYDAALQSIQFSSTTSDPTVGGTDTARTVTWAAHDDANAFSQTVTTTVHVDDAPVIAVDDLVVTHNDDGTTTVSGLSVTDADATSSELFTIAATTAGAASGTTVSPASSSGHLADINTTLQSGVAYDQGENPPSTDMVTLTVADAHGATDTVNLIFNLADNPATPVTLAGTTNQDVFFGTGHQDQFVFAAHSNHDTIVNFTPGQDQIDLSAVVTGVVTTSDASSWFSQHVAASPTNAADTLVTIDAADTIVLHNVLVQNLSANDFILHTT